MQHQAIPPNPPGSVATKAAERDKLVATARETEAAVEAAAAAVIAAEDADSADYASALRAGRGDPGTPHQDAARAALEAAERRRAAVGVAFGQVVAELEAAVDAAASKWATTVARRQAEEVATAKRLACELAAALENIRELQATAWFLAADPGGRRYRLAVPTSSGLHTANGDQLALSVLLGEVAGWVDRVNV